MTDRIKSIITISLILAFAGLGLLFVGKLFSLIVENKVESVLNARLGVTIIETASSDTLSTFRTNVNTSFTNINDVLAATTTANTFSVLQTFDGGASSTLLSVFENAYFGGTATTTIDSSGNVGIGSSSPTTALSIGTSGASSTISTGKLQFQGEDADGVLRCVILNNAGAFTSQTGACQ